MKEFAVDLRAEALLLTVVETVGGDLRSAFAILCGRASLADINGETFEAALGRAIAELFSRPAIVRGVHPVNEGAIQGSPTG